MSKNQLSIELENIENDYTLTQKEKDEQMREAEMAEGDGMRQQAQEQAEMDDYSKYM